MRTRRAGAVIGAALVLGLTGLRLDAHKPITSPYTFTEDVSPILRERCATCHVAGGPAPMALTTAEETVPWGESIRLELVAGHMPPWSAISNGTRMRHAEGLTARELNVLLTWVTGGTPPGDKPPAPAPPASAAWALGTPDAVIALPEVTVAADQSEVTREFVLPLDAATRRPLRAVDLRPGTRSLVRSARVLLRTTASAGANEAERVLALWVPGDSPVALPTGAAFAVPAEAELVAQVRYKKTWEHERETMTDRSEVGLYFATASSTPVRQLLVTSDALREAVRVLAVYPSLAVDGTHVTLDARPPGGEPRRLIDFTPRREWARRYTFDVPFDLPAGTRLQLVTSAPPESGALVLDVVPWPTR
jgi:hypothetical protein